MAFLDKILIANRGEIAVRIIRSAKDLEIRTVAVYVESENDANYVRLADEAVSLGSGELSTTFLNISRMIAIALAAGANAIHPGYGFLSENPEFAKACEDNNLVFIGPHSDVLRLMSNKPAAKLFAQSLGIPTISGCEIDLQSLDKFENKWQYPLLIKAAYGGGGKGMELVHNFETLKEGVVKSTRKAARYFGNGAVFIEQYIQNARHVEVQIMGDNYHNIIHLYERECSIQRNHQKIIEEAPAQFLSGQLREDLLNAAITIAEAVNYSGAGTVEFLIDGSGNYFFMEMNPRIQVEHAVTEEITGIDIVSEQLKIASGYPLSVSQKDVMVAGHAVEVRIYTENPSQNFAPSVLPVLSMQLPEHPDLRIESDINVTHQTMNQFDPLILKLIAFGKNRHDAIELVREKVSNLNIIGPETNTKYLEKILAHPDYLQNNISVEFCQNNHNQLIVNYLSKNIESHIYYLVAHAIEKNYLRRDLLSDNPWNHLGYWRLSDSSISLSIDNVDYGIGLNLSNKAVHSFTMNGISTRFDIENESGDTRLKIKGVSKQVTSVLDRQNNSWISCENTQYGLSLSGLLKNYPETAEGLDRESNFNSGEIKSPLYGKILEINVKENQIIKKGDLLVVIEAMKSENRILSPKDALVKSIAINVGVQVSDQMPLIFLEDLIV